MDHPAKKAALVDDHNELVVMFGYKDMISRVVAKDLPSDLTIVSSTMTSNSEIVSLEMLVIEAVQNMYINQFLILYVCRSGCRICGVVDVMELIYSCGCAGGWISIIKCFIDDDLHTEYIRSVGSQS